MAQKCFICQKGNIVSRRSQHHKGVAGGAWKHKAQKTVKLFKINLRKIRVNMDATNRRIKLCTDCLSKLKQTKQINISGKIIKLIVFNQITPTP